MDYRHRAIEGDILKALQHCPVVFLTGPRQAGKSTLLQKAYPKSRYRTLDDLDTLNNFKSDPLGALNEILRSSPETVIIDEAQRIPDLFIAVKAQVDREPKGSRFILSGSANIPLLKKIRENLAGRSVRIELFGFSWPEWECQPLPTPMIRLLTANQPSRILEDLAPVSLTGIKSRARSRDFFLKWGSLPPVLARDDEVQRMQWLQGYRQNYVEAEIIKLGYSPETSAFSRALGVAAHRIGQVVSFSSFGNEIGVGYHTLQSYFYLLNVTYQVFLLPPYLPNLGKRLVKSPKLYFWDLGVRNAVTGSYDIEPQRGILYENWAIAETIRQCHDLLPEPRFSFFGTHGGGEVDLIVEFEDRLIAIEIKSGGKGLRQAPRGLKDLLSHLPHRHKMGIVLSTNQEARRLEENIWTLPDSALLLGPDK